MWEKIESANFLSIKESFMLIIFEISDNILLEQRGIEKLFQNYFLNNCKKKKSIHLRYIFNFILCLVCNLCLVNICQKIFLRLNILTLHLHVYYVQSRSNKRTNYIFKFELKFVCSNYKLKYLCNSHNHAKYTSVIKQSGKRQWLSIILFINT